MKIYTKTGDKGETSLYDGNRVDKDSIRVESYGTIDELNSYLGVCLHYLEKEEDKKIVHSIQNKLFYIGAELATRQENKFEKIAKEEDVKNLENLIDMYRERTEDVNAFIVPGTSIASAHLHVARTICRRAERRIISLNKVEPLNSILIKYVNRLSDLIYALARYNESEIITMKF